MPTWKIELIEEAVADFRKLDGSVRKAVLKQLAKLEQDPRYGQPLGNKAGFDPLTEVKEGPGKIPSRQACFID